MLAPTLNLPVGSRKGSMLPSRTTWGLSVQKSVMIRFSNIMQSIQTIYRNLSKDKRFLRRSLGWDGDNREDRIHKFRLSNSSGAASRRSSAPRSLPKSEGAARIMLAACLPAA